MTENGNAAIIMSIFYLKYVDFSVWLPKHEGRGIMIAVESANAVHRLLVCKLHNLQGNLPGIWRRNLPNPLGAGPFGRVGARGPSEPAVVDSGAAACEDRLRRSAMGCSRARSSPGETRENMMTNQPESRFQVGFRLFCERYNQFVSRIYLLRRFVVFVYLLML